MEIVVIGCGKVGKTLVEHLAMEGHNVIVIDTNQKNVEEIVNSVNMSTEVTPNNTQTIDNIEGSFNNAEIRKLSRSGNIGVTTSQQMIESEIELRKKSIADWLIEFFVRKYMFTVGDDNEY